MAYMTFTADTDNKTQSTRYGYEVPGITLLQAYLYTYSLLRGVTFEVFPLSSYALSPMMLPLSSHIFWCHKYPEIFKPLSQTLFLETARSHSEPNHGDREAVPVQ